MVVMKRVDRILLGAVVLSLVIASPALALNLGDDNCAENPFIVDTALKAVRVANGYHCTTVDLVVKTSLIITETVLPISARSIAVTGPDILDPLKRVEIINNASNSDVLVTAENGNVTIVEGSLKAHRLLLVQCKGVTPLCKITVDSSDLIAAANFASPGGGGDTKVFGRGDVDIRRTNLHGGSRLEVAAIQGSLTIKCAVEFGCKDPVLQPPFTVKALCGDPPQFPCTVTFNTPADLQAVCIVGPDVKCNGGATEKRFTAKFDIDIAGSKIDSIEHMTFEAKEGSIKAAGAQLSSQIDNVRLTADGTVDISGATLLTPGGSTIVLAGPNCPAPPGLCINARESDIEGKDIVLLAKSGGVKGVIDLCGATLTDAGVDFPNLNSDALPPYPDPSVVDDAVECPAPPGPATIN
jgi:hypothetical protein